MSDNWWALSRGNRENEESYGPMGSGQLVDRQGLESLYFQFGRGCIESLGLDGFQRTRRGESVIGNALNIVFVTSGNPSRRYREIGQGKEKDKTLTKAGGGIALHHGAAPTSLFPSSVHQMPVVPLTPQPGRLGGVGSSACSLT